MAVRDPLSRAQNVNGPSAAAVLRDDLEYELAMGDDLDPARERDLEGAIDVLESRYPDLPPVGEGDSFAESRSRGGFGPPPRKGRPGTSQEEREEREASRVGARRNSSPRSSSRRRGRGAGSRLFASSTSSATSLGLYLAGITLGLAALYLILTNAQHAGKRSVINLTAEGVTRAVHRIVAPVDPIGPGARAAAGKPPAHRRTGHAP